jgi:hypothetical protein
MPVVMRSSDNLATNYSCECWTSSQGLSVATDLHLSTLSQEHYVFFRRDTDDGDDFVKPSSDEELSVALTLQKQPSPEQPRSDPQPIDVISRSSADRYASRRSTSLGGDDVFRSTPSLLTRTACDNAAKVTDLSRASPEPPLGSRKASKTCPLDDLARETSCRGLSAGGDQWHPEVARRAARSPGRQTSWPVNW